MEGSLSQHRRHYRDCLVAHARFNAALGVACSRTYAHVVAYVCSGPQFLVAFPLARRCCFPPGSPKGVASTTWRGSQYCTKSLSSVTPSQRCHRLLGQLQQPVAALLWNQPPQEQRANGGTAQLTCGSSGGTCGCLAPAHKSARREGKSAVLASSLSRRSRHLGRWWPGGGISSPCTNWTKTARRLLEMPLATPSWKGSSSLLPKDRCSGSSQEALMGRPTVDLIGQSSSLHDR